MPHTASGRSRWLRSLRRRYVATRLLRLWVRIPPGGGAWKFVCCECCVLRGRGLCTSWSLVQRSPTDCGASLCAITFELERRSDGQDETNSRFSQFCNSPKKISDTFFSINITCFVAEILYNRSSQFTQLKWHGFQLYVCCTSCESK